MRVYIESLTAGRKTKATHPYDYDPIIQFRVPGEANGTIYSDRLLQWDYARHNALCEKHFGDHGQHWERRDPLAIEAFLRDWTDDQKLKLVQVTEHCHAGNGFPVWKFDYWSIKKENA